MTPSNPVQTPSMDGVTKGQPDHTHTGTELDHRPVEDHPLPPLSGDPMGSQPAPGDPMEVPRCRACGGEVERFRSVDGSVSWWAHVARGDEVARHVAVVERPDVDLRTLSVKWTDEAREAVQSRIGHVMDNLTEFPSRSTLTFAALSALTPHVEAIVREARAEALWTAAREVDEASTIPGAARAAVSSVLRGRARRAQGVRRGE